MLTLWSRISAYVGGGLLAVLVISNTIWYISWDHQRDKYTDEKYAHSETILNYEKAQYEAELISTQKAREEEQKNAKKAQEADAAYASLLNKYNASIVRYQAAQREASTIYLSSSTESTDGVNQSRDSTEILITISDAQICAENTARLQAAHEWAVQITN